MLKRFQETDEVADLSGVQSELGHARMTRHNFFTQRLLERLDGIPQMKGSECRGNGYGTLRDLIDRMAMRTVGLRKYLTSLYV